MKQLFSLSLIYLLVYHMALAQPTEGQRERFRKRVPVEERVQRQTQIMTDSLVLSNEQVSVVSAINLKYIKAREEIILKDMTRQEKMFDLETLEIKQEKEFKKVLDKEQYKKLKVMEERRRALREKMMKERRSRQE